MYTYSERYAAVPARWEGGCSLAHYISLADITGTGLHWYWVVLLQTTFIPVCLPPNPSLTPTGACAPGTKHNAPAAGWEANDLWMDLAPHHLDPVKGTLINHRKTTQRKMGRASLRQVPHLLTFSHIMFPSGNCARIGSHFPKGDAKYWVRQVIRCC